MTWVVPAFRVTTLVAKILVGKAFHFWLWRIRVDCTDEQDAKNECDRIYVEKHINS